MPDELFGVTGTLDGKRSHDQLSVLQDGRVIAMGKNYIKQSTFFTTDGHAEGCEVINVRVPDLRMIEYVLNVQFFYEITDGVCAEPIYEAVNKKIVGNVVGMTLLGNPATGGTLHVEVIAIGPP
ncbi:unnamed protein product [marine sediment metagenome]|uniref:Uncharacterized protein n=2 Tax=marine sediment metagenome TaxID=412755 RepID=X1IJL1_9ZZZZ